MRITMAPVGPAAMAMPATGMPATGMPAGIRATADSALFGLMLADAGGAGPDTAAGLPVTDETDAAVATDPVSVDPFAVPVAPIVPAAVPVVPVDGVSADAALPASVAVSVSGAVTASVATPTPTPMAALEPVERTLPVAISARAGVGDEGLMVPPTTRGGRALPGVSVPTQVADGTAAASGRSPSPQPSPRGGEGVLVAPGLETAPADDAVSAPAAAVMRDVSALLAAQPVPVTMAGTVTGTMTGPGTMTAAAASIAIPAAMPLVPTTPLPVGVAETAIREQVAVLIAQDEAPEIGRDAADAPVAAPAAGMPIIAASGGPAAAMPVLSAEAAVGLHVAAAQAGQALDGIARDIATATGSSDTPMRFRLDPAALGPVLVEMARGPDGLAVRIETRDAGTRALIADQQGQLVTDARAAGVPIQTVQIEARRDDSSTLSGYAQHQADPQAGGGQQGQAGQRPAPAPRMPDAAERLGPARPAAGTEPGPRAGAELYA